MPGDRQSQIDQLVQSALALVPEERASFLAEACPDAALLEEVSRSLAIRLESSEWEAGNGAAVENVTEPALVDGRIGQTYGIYQVKRRIGAGGMGEVYLAFDTRLSRDVALKFLPARTAGDETLVRRFQSEARSASSLNHPNILTIFDVGKFGSDHYLASEYVEGTTLRGRLRQGPLEIAEAVEIATQVASALVAAHSAGIIHRDLKPTNIMLRPDGYVKVIDFGLAKRLSLQNGPAEEAYTKPGVMVGTVDYMSPEQARGEEVDARTDLWTLGIILYEMLSGRRPFEGQSQYHVLAQILDADPKPVHVTGGLPPSVEKVLTSCLAKDRDVRYPSARDLYADLKEARRALNLSSTTQSATTSPVRRHRRGLRAASAVALATFVAAGWWWMAWGNDWMLGPDAFDHTMRKVTFKGQVSLAAISPDGQYLAFVNGAPTQELEIKQLDSSNDTALIPRAGVRYTGITFSKDERYVYYVTRSQERGQLRRIAITGGDSSFVADDVDGPVAFGPKGDEIAFRRDANNLSYVVLTRGSGRDERLTKGEVDGLDRRLSWSAQNNRIALFRYPPPGDSGMRFELLNPDDRKTGPLVRIPDWRGVSQSAWMSNGHDLVVPTETQDEGEESMQLRSFSTLNGRSRNVTSDSYGYHGASITADGNRLVTVRSDRQTRFWVIPAANLNEGGPIRAADSGLYSSVNWTDDNKLVTQANRGGGTNVWLVDPESGHLQKLTSGQYIARDPVWLPRAKAIVYAADRNGLWQTAAADGSTQLLTRAPGYLESPTCAPDGSLIVYTVWEPHEASVWAQLPAGGVQGARMLLHNARHPVISPDGRTLVVERADDTADGGWRTVLYTLSDMQPIRSIAQIPTGSRLRWHPDGRALTYIVTDRDGTSNLWAQPIDGGAPRRLTSFREDQIFDYAWSPDGSQLVCLRGTTISDAFLLTRKQSMLGRLIAWANPSSFK